VADRTPNWIFSGDIAMTTTRDRRRKNRLETKKPVTVRFVTAEFRTETTNISADGMYFLTKSPLMIEVVLEDGPTKTTHRGRLVRVESLTANHDQMGFAVRFSAEDVLGAKKKA
jgi:hypothetical protein